MGNRKETMESKVNNTIDARAIHDGARATHDGTRSTHDEAKSTYDDARLTHDRKKSTTLLMQG